MKPDEKNPRSRLALWLLLGALALALIGIAAWRIVHWIVCTQLPEKRAALKTSAWKVTRGSALALAGLSVKDVYLPCEGKVGMGYALKQHPDARLYYSSIDPGKQIAVGQTLHATAIFTCPPGAGIPVIRFTDFTDNEADDYVGQLFDDGTHGDRIANDGIWELDLVWQRNWLFNGHAWVSVWLGLAGGYDSILGADATLQDVTPAPGNTSLSEGTT